MSASQVAQSMLSASAKRLATLEKSLEKKRRALKVQEELEKPATPADLESHKTFIYYTSELERVEEEFARKRALIDEQEARDKEIMERRKLEMIQKLEQEHALRKARYQKEVSNAYTEAEKKTKYYRDAIEALKEKLSTPQPTGKVYRRLKAEVEMEQREYDELKKQYQENAQAFNTVIVPQELEKMRRDALAAEVARKHQEEQQLQEQREAAIAARKAREAADEARQLADLEAAQKSQKVEEPPSRAPETFSYLLQRIKNATCMKDLEDLSTEKMTPEESDLWEERYDLFGEQEMRAKEEQANSIVSDPAPEVPEIDEQKIEAALQASIAQDMEAQDRIINTLTFEESRELSRRLAAHYSKPKAAPKVAPLGAFHPVAQTSEAAFPPILKTTKKFVVRQSGQQAPPAGSIRR